MVYDGTEEQKEAFKRIRASGGHVTVHGAPIGWPDDVRPITESATEPYRYEVTCWNDQCSESFDTYGTYEQVMPLAREHVSKNGCELRVQVHSIITVKLGD